MAKHRNQHPLYYQFVKNANRLRKQTEEFRLPCAYCGKPIDLSLPPRHRMSFSADHVVPLSQGGRMDGALQPMHFSCNSKAGAKKRRSLLKRPKTSRVW